MLKAVQRRSYLNLDTCLRSNRTTQCEAIVDSCGAFASRERPQSCEEAAFRPADKEEPIIVCHEPEDDGHRGHTAGPQPRRELLLIAFRTGDAYRLERASSAIRRGGSAYRRAELHEGLVEIPRSARVDEVPRSVDDVPLAPGRCDIPKPEETREHTRHISVHRRRGKPVSDAGDRPGRVRSNSRERFESCDIVRDGAPVALDDYPRRRMEIPSPAVKSKALPGTKDVFVGRRREVPHGREALKEACVIRRARDDAGPLQEAFRNEDSIRIARSTPRELSAMHVEPWEKPRPHGLRRRFFHERAMSAGILNPGATGRA